MLVLLSAANRLDQTSQFLVAKNLVEFASSASGLWFVPDPLIYGAPNRDDLYFFGVC